MYTITKLEPVVYGNDINGAELVGFVYTQNDGGQYESGPVFTKDEWKAIKDHVEDEVIENHPEWFPYDEDNHD